MLLTVTLRVRIPYYHFTCCLVIMWTSRTMKSILTSVHSYTSDDEICDCGDEQVGKILSPGLRGSSKDSGCFQQRKVPPLRSRQTGGIGHRGYATRMVVNVFNFLSSLQCESIFDPTCNEIQGRDQRRSAFLFSTSQDGRTEQCRRGPGHILNIRILKELLRNLAHSTISPWRENNLKSVVFRRIWEIGAAPLGSRS